VVIHSVLQCRIDCDGTDLALGVSWGKPTILSILSVGAEKRMSQIDHSESKKSGDVKNSSGFLDKLIANGLSHLTV
jgi:hypothetical protein